MWATVVNRTTECLWSTFCAVEYNSFKCPNVAVQKRIGQGEFHCIRGRRVNTCVWVSYDFNPVLSIRPFPSNVYNF